MNESYGNCIKFYMRVIPYTQGVSCNTKFSGFDATLSAFRLWNFNCLQLRYHKTKINVTACEYEQ